VFHVRGPRLAPSDFKGLASQAMDGSQDGILMFRGSGGVCEELAGNNGQILSSESTDVPPVIDRDGSAVKLARAKPDMAVRFVERGIRRATAAWYQRTKPGADGGADAWLDKEKPHLLAPVTDGEFIGIGERSPRRHQPNNCRVSGFQSEFAAWKEIKRADPSV